MLIEGAPVRIRMEHVTKRYGAVLSLDDVSLELRAGEVLGLVGDGVEDALTQLELAHLGFDFLRTSGQKHPTENIRGFFFAGDHYAAAGQIGRASCRERV